ncbi:MAG: FliM/FliN family flagellar motor C-terminal domain-containing protein [Thalassovita sp.]
MQLKTASQPVRDSAAMRPEIALERALYRAAHLGLGLTLEISGAHPDRQGRDGVLDGVQATDLIVKLEQEGETPGVMALDLNLVSALVEVQTLGCVMDASAMARSLTSTDAAVAMPLIDGTLSGFEALVPRSEQETAPGFHFGAWIPDLSLLTAQLPDGAYDTFELSVSIGTRDRTGRLFLALPVPPEPAPEIQETPEATTQESLTQEVMDAPARLDVVLHRMELPLGEIGALKTGDVLTLPVRALSEVTLHAGERKPVAIGVLGQLSGQRAVCLKNFGAGRGKPQSTPAEQANSLAGVDLADPGLIASVSEKPALPQPEPTTIVQENADDILRDLGLSEGIPADVGGNDPANLPALPSETLPGQDSADG